MTANERIRLLIHHRLSARAALMRTLASLAAQDIGPAESMWFWPAPSHAPECAGFEFLCNALGSEQHTVCSTPQE
jgi:RimJ/RimL family protein N-acetyltransferase